jgi:NAD(P)-dependent dehydrogenase (short-subunit alcohol dehydrogenase family)
MRNLLDLNDKIILITGGVGAIGRVTVKLLAEYGAMVAVNDIVSEAEAAQVLQDVGAVGPQIAYFRADNNDPAAVAELFAAVNARFGLPNVVCCHAGMVRQAPLEQFTLAEFDLQMNVNVRGAFVVAQSAVQAWDRASQPGHLIFTSSWVQDVPWPEITPYTASKAAVRQLARGFARELAGKNIRANVVAPGIVSVGLAKRQWDNDPGYRARAQKAIPLGYMQPPESIAHAFLYLCSPLADYMTGSVLLVDGGCSLYPMD